MVKSFIDKMLLLHHGIYCTGPFSLSFGVNWPTLPQIVDYLNQSSLHLTFKAVKVLPEKNYIHMRHSFDQLSSFRLHSVHAVHHREQDRTRVYFPSLAVCLKNETINSSLFLCCRPLCCDALLSSSSVSGPHLMLSGKTNKREKKRFCRSFNSLVLCILTACLSTETRFPKRD